MINVGQSGEWAKAAAILGTAPAKVRMAMDRAVLAEAQLFRRRVVEGFRDQAPGGKAFEPLKPTTLAIRRFHGFGGTKALNVRGDLRNSIKVTKKPTLMGVEAFVGVLRSEKGKDGKSLVNIAEIHEFGKGPIVIPVTPAMRRFLMAAFTQELGAEGGGGGGGGLSRGIIIVRIPPRPFLQPVADKWFTGPQAAARFQQRVAANLSGLMGAFGPSGGTTVKTAIRRSHGGPTRDPVTGRFLSGK